MNITDINIHDMASLLLASPHYQAGGRGTYYIWRYFGPGQSSEDVSSKSSNLWREAISDSQFISGVEKAVSAALSSIPRSPIRPEYLRLTRVIKATESLLDEVAMGKKDFGDCWSMNWADNR